MTTATPSAPTGVATGPPTGRCRGVEVFAAGAYRGDLYTPADLDQIAANFAALGPEGAGLLQPPVVIGHEEPEDQQFLDRTDLPAAGWVASCKHRASDHKLVADFKEVPPEIADAINSRAYRKCSAEIYDDFTDDAGTSYGKALRRVVILGGEIPQVKSLADIPFVEFSERGRRDHHGTYRTFAWESSSMINRQEAVQKLLAAGMEQGVLDTMTDEQLQEALATIEGAAMPAADAATAFADPATASVEEMVAELTALGEDPAALAAMPEEELRALYAELTGAGAAAAPPAEGDMGAMMAEGEVTMTRDDMIAALTAQGQDPAALAAMGDEELKALLAGAAPAAQAPAAPMGEKGKKPRMYSERVVKALVGAAVKRATRAATQATVKTFSEKLTRLEKAVQANTRTQLGARREAVLAERRKGVKAFCERMVEAGKMLPGQKRFFESIFRVLAEVPGVRKFAEVKKDGKAQLVERSPLAHAFLEYERTAPVVLKFGEKLPAGAGAGVVVSRATDPEEQKVERHGLRVFKDQEKARGYVAKFSELRKKRPTLTAKDYCGPEADVA